MYENYLAHYGVLGMRWGKRKSIESERTIIAKKKFSEEKINYKKIITNPLKTAQAKRSAANNFLDSREELMSSKLLDKIASRPKTKNQIRMEQVYKSKGLPEEDAIIQAYKHERTKKLLIGAAVGIGVVSAVVIGKKYYENNVDKVFNSDKSLYRMTIDGNQGVKDAFYAATNKRDANLYKGLYGATLDSNGHIVYQKTMKIKTELKQASLKNAKKTFDDLYDSDKEFKKQIDTYFKDNQLKYFANPKLYGRMEDINSKNQLSLKSKHLYDMFNATIVDARNDADLGSATKKYFDVMEKKGYNAIKDMNDYKYSGYGAKNPIIVFGKHTSILDIPSVRKVDSDEIGKQSVKELLKISAKQSAPTAALAIGSNIAIRKLNSFAENKIIENYRKRHPGTKMTNNQIRSSIRKNGIS